MDEPAALGVDRDELFTVIVDLKRQPHYEAFELRLDWGWIDLARAAGELEAGPWQRVAGPPRVVRVSFTRGCVLLDRLLEELARVTPGFGARIAVTQARAWLDAEHSYDHQPLNG